MRAQDDTGIIRIQYGAGHCLVLLLFKWHCLDQNMGCLLLILFDVLQYLPGRLTQIKNESFPNSYYNCLIYIY